MDKYKKAFKAYIGGEVSPTQTWGFGTPEAARTRATGEFADHEGAYPDANMWTSKGFLAPDPLTPSQKLRAQYYFQMNKIVNPNRPNYGRIDFFMQQVYDGGDDPMTNYNDGNNPLTGQPYSKEVYLAANGSTYIQSGEHMDHLTASNGEDRQHIYNFNNGNCSTNDNVADRDQTDVNDTDKQHSDKIQLMLNTKTNCFGYANSDASYVRDDRWTLVSAATIDTFCDNDPGFADWLASRLPTGENDVKCVDDFNRSYIGFDFDMLPDDEVFACQRVAPYTKENNYRGEIASYYWYKPEIYGETVHYVSANSNEYCGESRTIDPEPTQDEANELIEEGWLPAINTANKTWIKVGGCADGYYSDWIVTFMPASSGSEPDPDAWFVRVMAEDLSADEASDFDFNDVVIDVYYTQGKTNATIVLQAAGGTLPLRIAGNDNWEVHKLFDVPVTTMVNTNWSGSNSANCDPVTLTLTNFGPYDTENAFLNGVRDDIALEVKKTLSTGTSQWFPMTANQGEPAAKFAVDGKYKWLDERTNIKEQNGSFVDWVTGKIGELEWY